MLGEAEVRSVRIAMAQMLVEGGRADSNLARAAERIAQAKAAGCRIVVLPECLNLGWTHPSAREFAQPIPGPHSDVLCRAAADNGIWVVAGLVESAGDKIFNSAVLIQPDGEIALSHRKINELELAHDLYALGSSVGLAETPFGRIGLLICADNFPDSLELGRALGRMGCRLLLSPCAWAVPADHDNLSEPYGDLWREAYSALTRDFPMAVVGVSNVGPVEAGPWAGRQCIGCSLAVGPGGEILAQGPYGEAAEALSVIEIELDADPAGGAATSPIAASRR